MRFLFLISLLLLAATTGIAQDVVDVATTPSWIIDLTMFLNQLPGVGPYLTLAFDWVGALAVITTAVAGAAVLSLHALGKVLKSRGLDEKADKLEKLANPVLYWLKYASLLNAQKKPEEKVQAAQKK